MRTRKLNEQIRRKQYTVLPSLTYVNLVMPIITRGKSGGAIITESVEKK